MVNEADRQAAPGALEEVRELLNSWLIPNDTRQPTDRFDAYAESRRVAKHSRPLLRELRDDLRAVVERHADADARLNSWIKRLGVTVEVHNGRLAFTQDDGLTAHILTTVLQAITDDQWSRLKACPDCRWVFYDHTRNGSKRWCLMTAGGTGGRSCGSIAKVRRHRDRISER